MKPILILGLPGSGKTALATALSKTLNAVHWNADTVRANINKDLGFTEKDRVEQSARMGWLSRVVISSGNKCIADLVCPTEECRAAFGDAFIIWVDRIKVSRFEDTNKIFTAPSEYDCRIPYGLTLEEEVSFITTVLDRSHFYSV
jgi:adenylylsulfate kinase